MQRVEDVLEIVRDAGGHLARAPAASRRGPAPPSTRAARRTSGPAPRTAPPCPARWPPDRPRPVASASRSSSSGCPAAVSSTSTPYRSPLATRGMVQAPAKSGPAAPAAPCPARRRSGRARSPSPRGPRAGRPRRPPAGGRRRTPCSTAAARAPSCSTISSTSKRRMRAGSSASDTRRLERTRSRVQPSRGICRHCVHPRGAVKVPPRKLFAMAARLRLQMKGPPVGRGEHDARGLHGEAEAGRARAGQPARVLRDHRRGSRAPAALRPLAERHSQASSRGLYELLLGHAESRSFFPDEATVARVKRMQREYFLGLFDGRCDSAYVEDRAARRRGPRAHRPARPSGTSAPTAGTCA